MNAWTVAHCPDCGHDYLVAYSCKGRGICPSCATLRMVETAARPGEIERENPETWREMAVDDGERRQGYFKDGG